MNGPGNLSRIHTTQGGRIGWPYCLWLDIPAFGCLYLKAPTPPEVREKQEQQQKEKEGDKGGSSAAVTNGYEGGGSGGRGGGGRGGGGGYDPGRTYTHYAAIDASRGDPVDPEYMD